MCSLSVAQRIRITAIVSVSRRRTPIHNSPMQRKQRAAATIPRPAAALNIRATGVAAAQPAVQDLSGQPVMRSASPHCRIAETHVDAVRR